VQQGIESKKEIDWPFPERRNPKLDDPDFLGSKGLVLGLRRAIQMELCGKRELNILDVGCGQKPFYPLLKRFARSYVGTDVIQNSPLVDIVCPAEAIKVQDEWADVVLCLSVLEHVNDPIKAVKELYRVVKPTGVIFASTHGFFPWHPSPQDHWRWTQTGLPILFQAYGGFSSVSIFATRGTISGVFFLLAHYVYAWASQNRLKLILRGPLTIAVNRMGEFLDRKYSSLGDMNRHVTAIPEFFVIAKKS
jgi:SAM-dependent methyltransferase